MQQNNTPKGEPFTGSAVEMKDTPWLAVEDIADKVPLKVTIADVEHYAKVTMDAGRVETNKYALVFKGASKKLIINATNRKAMQRAFGSNTEKWRGQAVTLTVEPLKRVFNEHTHGIRIAANANSAT